MKYISFLALLLLTACGKQAKLDAAMFEKQQQLDAAKLESILSNSQIDRVEVVIPFERTNILTDAAANQYALSLRDTNRVSEADTTKSQVMTEVLLMSGTNELAWLSQYENGIWRYEHYSFRLRTSP